ncbi:MAG: hypothetical protein J6M62_00355, partial [Selenomonadaceae bacterium]|nr:hypothetical protein [Selenomonadaceae bacterium]
LLSSFLSFFYKRKREKKKVTKKKREKENFNIKNKNGVQGALLPAGVKGQSPCGVWGKAPINYCTFTSPASTFL